MIGLALKPNVVNTLLGATILFIVAIMATAKKSTSRGAQPDKLSQALGSWASTRESIGKDVEWNVIRPPGSSALRRHRHHGGMFGLGAGWANVRC